MLKRSAAYNNFNYHFTLIMAVAITFWWPCCCSAYKVQTMQFNPNIRCAGKNVENIWRPCTHGGYIENLDPKNCADRYVCFRGLNEDCSPGIDKCADNALCTNCGVCQKCDRPEDCSDFNLCSTASGYNTLNLIKRLIQKRFTEFNDN